MQVQYLKRENAPDLAYEYTQGTQPDLPALVFLGGFRSDMTGTKARWLADYAAGRGQSLIRFDYRGHGHSGGRFEDSVLSDWCADALHIIHALVPGQVALVGSSMGGWIALRIAPKIAARLAGVVGIAAAPDFTRDITDEMNAAQHAEMEARGFFVIPSGYSPEPYTITRGLIEDGEKNLILTAKQNLRTHIRLLQGQRDTDVDWQKAYAIRDAYPESDVRVVLIDDADHRLLRPPDLGILAVLIDEISTLPPFGA